MIPKSIQSLLSTIQRQGIDVIVGGGLAVNQHGFSRLTTDADLIASTESKDQIQEILTGLGFIVKDSTDIATRFGHSSFSVPFVDLLWTDPKTFAVFLETAVNAGLECKVLSLPHLVAMKIHAISQSEDRMAKDSEDIRWLLKFDPTALCQEDYQDLLNRFASASTKDYLLALYPDQ